MLRVRRSAGRPALLTLKSGTEVEAGYFRSEETEAVLDEGALPEVLARPASLWGLDLAPVAALRSRVGELPLQVIGRLLNERTSFRTEGWTVEVDRMTSLAVLSRYAECDVEIIKELNPELLRATTPPGTYKLRVPPGMSQATARALARIPANQRLDFKPYRIRRGDTLARLASRFNVSVDDLLAANNLTKSSFKVGRTIQVPPPPPTPIDERDLKPKEERARSIANKPLDSLPDLPPTPAASSAAEPGEEETGAELPRPEPPVAPAKPAPAPRVKPSPVKEAAAKPSAGKSPAPKAATHLVKRGETLFAIAERYGVEVIVR
jgi:membrane-bound lytic murein transglycosylase D